MSILEAWARSTPATRQTLRVDAAIIGRQSRQAKAEILGFAGTQFDPAAVEAFVAEEHVLREMVAVKCAAEWTEASLADGPRSEMTRNARPR